MPKKITLDKLAEMTAKGFSEMGKGINKLDIKIDNVDKKLSGKIDNVDKKLSGKIDNTNNRLDIMERDIKDIKDKIRQGITRKEYLEIDERLTIIEDKLGIAY